MQWLVQGYVVVLLHRSGFTHCAGWLHPASVRSLTVDGNRDERDNTHIP